MEKTDVNSQSTLTEGKSDKSDVSLLSFFKEFAQENPQVKSEESDFTLNTLASFVRERNGLDDVSIKSVDIRFIQDFHYFLKSRKEVIQDEKLVQTVHQVLRKALKEALTAKIIKKDPYAIFKLSSRERFKKFLLNIYEKIGYKYLRKQPSYSFLENYILAKQENPIRTIPELVSMDGIKSPYFKDPVLLKPDPNYVWKVDDAGLLSKLKITPTGSVILNRTIIDLDYGPGKVLPKLKSRKGLEADTVIVPWSHRWGSYYDFLIMVTGKLCRIENALGKDHFSQSVVYCSLRGQRYEQDLLERFSYKAFYDTKEYYLHRVKTLVMANSQQLNYPSLYDIQLLRQKFQPSKIDAASRSIFLNRKGSRKVTNWSELQPLLKHYQFEIIDPGDLSLQEQIDLFNQAKIIIGPHGAGFTNILWCQPNTHIIEFFAQGYFPPYYYYLSQLLQLPYDCLVDKTEHDEAFEHKKRDMTVNIDLLERKLKSFF